MPLNKFLANSVILLSASILSSCMGAMMLGTGDHGSQSEGHSATEATLEKEVTAGGMKATAIFPAVEIGKEVVFTLTLLDSKSGDPIRRAKVYSHVEFKHSTESYHEMNDMAMEDSSHIMKKDEQNGIDNQQEVDESSTPGTYSFSLKPHQSGIHTITFHITEVDGQLLSPALVIEAKRNVAEQMKMDGMMGMMGMGSSTTYVVIGTAVLATMMITMWLVRGTGF